MHFQTSQKYFRIEIDLSTFFSTFDKGRLANIHRHYWKERRKISKPAKFESDKPELGEDKLCKVATFYRRLYGGGAQTCPPPYN